MTDTVMEEKKQNNKKKFLFVSFESLSGDLAWQIKKEGHDVKVFIEKESDKEVYDGFLEKVDNWKDYIDKVDVIVFDDIGFGDIADELRAKGKLVIGGSKYTDRLESDREFGQNEMQRVGMNILPHWDFSNFDEAISFIKSNPGRYVFKPSGDASNQKGILFLGQEEDGKDIIEILEQNKKLWAKKIKRFQLQKRAVGVEVACMDKETEILTDKGWRFFNELDRTERVATLNSKTKEIIYQKPIRYIKRFDEKIYKYNHRKSLDFAVTKDHNMAIIKHCSLYYKKKEDIQLIKLKDLDYHTFIKKNGIWKGKEKEFFTLPRTFRISGQRGKEKVEKKKIMMSDWLEFLGWYFSEGSVTRYGYLTLITQSKKHKDKRQIIKNILSKLPFKWNENGIDFRISSKQLYEYLVQFGKKDEKLFPNFIKELSQNQIRIFLDNFFLGDGNLHKGTKQYFIGTSKTMADQLQELLLKSGTYGVIKKIKPKPYFNKKFKRMINSKKITYKVIEYKEKYSSIFKDKIKEENYFDYTYCVEVPNHIIYIRRNGKPMWIGNCGAFFNGEDFVYPININFEHKKLFPGEVGPSTGEMGNVMFHGQPNEIFNSTLLKLKDDLKKSGYSGYFDINCIVNSRGIYPLEVTSRFGFPLISIQIEGTISPWGEFLYSLAKKEKIDLKTKKGFQIGVVIAIPPFPFDDKNESYIYRDLSILFKKDLEGVHLGDAKLIDNVWSIAGDSGYALVITGSGTTVEEARKQVYSRIKNIMLQNMYYRTDIGERWSEDSDKLHTWGYLYR